MKINSNSGAGPTRSATSAGAGKNASPGGFSVDSAARSASNVAAAEAAPSALLSALIALQAGGSPDERVRRAQTIAAAKNLLDLLEELRDGYLEGGLQHERLDGLARAAEERGQVADPALAEIYAQISLRARVELAKLGR